jgi:hypothetical protein
MVSKYKKMKNPKRRGPKPYDQDRDPTLIFALASIGKTDAEIAKYLHLAPDTLRRWKKKWPDVCRALEDARAMGLNLAIENKLYQAALGLETTSETVRGRMEINKLTGLKELVPTDVTKTKTVSPHVGVGMWILERARREKWGGSGPGGVTGRGLIGEGPQEGATNVFIVLPSKNPVPEDTPALNGQGDGKE